LLDDGLTLKEIAVLRGVTEATIIGHIEKLVEEGEKVDLKHVLPNKKVVTDIEKAFKKLKTEKLSPVYEHLQGKYSYEMIRLVRILQKN
jgi:ATP-dependent DNA helicase RecQ